MTETLKPDQDKKDAGVVFEEHMEVPDDPHAKTEPPPKMVVDPELERLQSSRT